MKEKLLKPNEVAEMLGIGYYALRRWVLAGKIEYIKLPSGQYRFTQSIVDAFLEKGKQGGKHGS